MAPFVAIFECPSCGAAVAPNESKCGYCKTALSVSTNPHGYAANEYDRAIAEYTQAITHNPTDSLAYHNRGFAYESKGDYERAMSDYGEAIRLDPNNSLAYRRRARSFQNKGDYQHALSDVNEAVRLNPDDDIAVSLLVGTKRTLDALGGIRQSIEAQSAIHEQSALLLDRIRESLDPYGITAATDNIRVKPSAESYIERANAYIKRAHASSDEKARSADFASAVADYEQALQLEPKNPHTYREYANMYLKRAADAEAAENWKDYRAHEQAAMQVYAKGVQNDPQNIVLRLQRAQLCLDKQSNYDIAIGDYNKVLELQPENKDAKKPLTLAQSKYRAARSKERRLAVADHPVIVGLLAVAICVLISYMLASTSFPEHPISTVFWIIVLFVFGLPAIFLGIMKVAES